MPFSHFCRVKFSPITYFKRMDILKFRVLEKKSKICIYKRGIAKCKTDEVSLILDEDENNRDRKQNST